jgi:hypothetical protein
MIAPTLALTAYAMFFAQPRLTERALADVAVISIPRAVKEETYKGIRTDQPGRLTFTFSTSYFWASFGSGTAYKHQLFVSVMAPDATDSQYAEYPKHFDLSYDHRRQVRTAAVGSGTLTIYEGVYTQNSLAEPSHTYLYVDRKRRLQIAWHAVKKEIDLAAGAEAVGRMAASFRIVREPTAEFAEMRDRPRKEAAERADKLAMAIETLKRAGYGTLEPGKPIFRDSIYVEWMSDPEPRFQLLLPLGRIRTDPNSPRGNRPRPVRLDLASGMQRVWNGTVGWREHIDGDWELSNNYNAYLPFEGIRAVMAAQQSDPAFTYFYYSGTVRVEHAGLDELRDLQWFFADLPHIRRLWREGKLVRGGTPEDD